MPVGDSSAVREQLGKILSSPVFVNSPRMSRFLRFVVETTLEGDGERIKEYVIAIEVFEKPEDYDPQADSTVRTEAPNCDPGSPGITTPKAAKTSS